MSRKLRMGMIGGGPDSFIGAVHRRAAALDGEIDLVSGAFSSDAAKSKEAGDALHLNPHRIYGSFAEMIEKEKLLTSDMRMDFCEWISFPS
jgi:predicted dehydrogenase